MGYPTSLESGRMRLVDRLIGKRAGSQPDEQYLVLLEDTDFRPIFILGLHRSGTTVLYRLLVATRCFNFVSAYHVARNGLILFNHVNQLEEAARAELEAAFESLGLTDRIIDGVTVTPDLPEEYGFILRDAKFRPRLDPQNLADFVEFCKKVQYVSDPDRPLLLKNPRDFGNFLYIKHAFPAAKLVFIHRHPIHVVNSQLTAIRSLFDEKNAYTALLAEWYRELYASPLRLFAMRLLFSSHVDLGLRVVAQHLVRATSDFLEQIGDLSGTDYVSVRYEDLCQDPETNVARILDFLEMSPPVALSYDAFIEPRSVHLLPEVDRWQDQIRRTLAPYFAYCGYD
jgi:hypothetical protein